ncbi:MAG: Autotransporter adhesin [Parcubacteria group bacterium]|nr:Autotransporter adhesin [Parcubacteria group bacterium]
MFFTQLARDARGVPARGFSTLEMLIAMTVLVLSISAVMLLFPIADSSGIDTELSREALDLARETLVREQALGDEDFKLVVATTTDTSEDGIVFRKTVGVTAPSLFTKKVTVTVSWGGLYNRSQSVALSSWGTDFENVAGGDTCNSAATEDWSFPRATHLLFGGVRGLADPSGSYPLTDIDVFRGRLYATVNGSVSPLPSQGPVNPAAAITSAGGTIAWTNPSSARVSDTLSATASIPAGASSQYLKVWNFGFSVPTGATILGIAVDVERNGAGIRDGSVRILRADGSEGALNKARATGWPVNEAYATYGGSNDLWGETGWSASAVNDPDFGVELSVTNPSLTAKTAAIDNVRITVTYTRQFYILDVRGTRTLISALGQNTISTGMNAVVVATSTAMGNYAYVATNSTIAHLEILDVGGPVATVTSTFQLPSANVVANTIFYRNGYAYLGLANNPSGPEFAIIDVHAPATPRLIGTYEVGAGINAISLTKSFAYLATSDSSRELIRLSLADLPRPALDASYNAPGANGSGFGRSLYTIGDTLYFGRYYSLTSAPEFSILNTSGVPALRGTYDLGPSNTSPYGAYGVIVRDTLAYVLTASQSNGGKLQLINVADQAAPTVAAAVTLPNSGAGVALDCERETLYAASVPASGTYAGRGSLSIVTAP